MNPINIVTSCTSFNTEQSFQPYISFKLSHDPKRCKRTDFLLWVDRLFYRPMWGQLGGVCDAGTLS